MELKDFVRGALIDVISGVSEAKKNEEVGKLIAPRLIGHQEFPASSGVLGNGPYFTTVKFSVALTASETDESGATGGLKIAVVSADLGGKVSSLNQTVTTLDFAVHLQMPE